MASEQQLNSDAPWKRVDNEYPVSPVPTQYSVSTAPSSASTTTTARGSPLAAAAPSSPYGAAYSENSSYGSASPYHSPYGKYYNDDEISGGVAGFQEDVEDLKSDLDVYRERAANLQALELLDRHVKSKRKQQQQQQQGGAIHGGGGTTGGALAAREAAIAKYNRKKQAEKIARNAERMAINQKYLDDRAKYGKKTVDHIAAPSLVKVKLAETSRKIVPKNENDPSFEAANGIREMKCQLDLDREAWAKRKAMRLLNEGYFL